MGQKGVEGGTRTPVARNTERQAKKREREKKEGITKPRAASVPANVRRGKPKPILKRTDKGTMHRAGADEKTKQENVGGTEEKEARLEEGIQTRKGGGTERTRVQPKKKNKTKGRSAEELKQASTGGARRAERG